MPQSTEPHQPGHSELSFKFPLIWLFFLSIVTHSKIFKPLKPEILSFSEPSRHIQLVTEPVGREFVIGEDVILGGLWGISAS